MLGVMLLVIVQCVMGGFGEIYRQKIVETNGHITIRGRGIIYNSEEVVSKVQDLDHVEAVSPYAFGYVMLQFNDRPSFPVMRGIDLNRDDPVVALDEFLINASVQELDDDSVFISLSLARNLSIRKGHVVEVYTPLMLEKLKKDEILLPRELLVAGIYETGWHDFDSNTMVCSLDLMRELYNLGQGVHGIAIRLDDDADEFELSLEIEQFLQPNLSALTWLELFEDFLWVLKLEKNMMFFLLLFIVIVSAFVIAIAQLLTVLRKTREIGLLGSMGAQPSQLIACYCFQGFFIGFLGTALGIVVGLFFLYIRDSIIYGFAKITGSTDVLIKFYQFAHLPVKYDKYDFIWISIAAILLATIAGLVPAWRAAKMKPADALRME